MFGGDDDDNPFANAISPFGSSSVYTPAASFSPTQPTFGSSPPRQLTDPFAGGPPPSLSRSSFQATPRDEYGFADEHPYGAPLDAPILSPKEDRPSPYVAAIEKVEREEEHNDQDEGANGSGFGSTSFNNNNIGSYHTQHQDVPSPMTSGFGGGGGGMEGFEAASSSTFGVPSYSQPPIVDLHAVEEELVASQPSPGGRRTSVGGFNPLLGLLGETEEEKMKSAFKPSVRTPVKKKVAPPPKKDTVKKEINPLVLDKKKENIVAPEPVVLAAPSSTEPEKHGELEVDDVPTPPPRPSTPPPAPPVLEDSNPTPLASPQPQLPITNLETPSSPSPPSHSPSSTPLPVSTPSSPPLPPPAPLPAQSSTPSSPTPNHSSTPSLFTESTSSDTLPPTPHVGRVVVSPLETPTQEFDRSFASLALGGSSSGWGGEEQDQQTIVSSSMVGSGSGGWGGDAGGGWGAVGPEASSLGEQQEEEVDEEEEEDNRPLQARVDRARSSSPPPPPTQAMAIEGEKAANKMFEIHVGDPTKVGLAATAHIVYTVTTRTTSQSAFSRQDVSVLRRFSDFLWLFTILQTNNPGVIVPPVPDKHPFGAYFFSSSDSNFAPSRRFAEDFVETRRNALEQCLQKMANHPVLQLDPDLRLFLESDTLSMEMKNRKAEVASEQKGYLASLTSTLSGPKYYERDEWFDQKKLVLDTLESQLKILVKSIELVSKQRLDLAVATSDFAEAIASLAASDLSKQLSHALERLADIGRRSRDVHEDNAKGDVRTFMSTADEYIRLIASVRLAFSSRVKTYLSWQSLEAESRRLRTNLEKARKAGKVPQERVGMEIQIVAEAERRSKEAQAEYESVSRLVKNEFVRFETERVEDFKTALERFLEGMIKRQKILIAAFEDYHRDLLKLVQQNPTSGRQPPPSPLPPAAQEEEASSSSVSETASSFVNGGPPPDENAWA